MGTSHFKKVKGVKGSEIAKARDYWIFLVAQHEMSRLEMDELGLLGI